MARQRKTAKRNIENYAHTGETRLNNPPVGLVTSDNNKDAGDSLLVMNNLVEDARFEL